MLRSVIAATRAFQALKPSVRLTRGFCIYASYLDPTKHISMNHNPNNMYEDLVMIGDYPVPAKAQVRIPSQQYVPQIAQITFDVLNKAYVRLTSLPVSDYCM
jgi:hypothetical protein